MFKIIPQKNNVAVEINCDLNKLTNNKLKKIKLALENYGLVFFRKQKLSSKNYLNFAKKFGILANYPRLKGLSNKYPKITVVERKKSDQGPSFGEQFHTDSSYTKRPPRFTMLLSRLVPERGKANTEFSSQYQSFKDLPIKFKKKLKNLKAVFSSEGPISITRLDRENEKGKNKKELKANHKIIKKIKKKFTIYCSPGHFKNFLSKNKKLNKELEKFLFKHQVKKKFQYSLEWEKNQLAIWDNRSMLHQATPFKGARIMHRITIQ